MCSLVVSSPCLVAGPQPVPKCALLSQKAGVGEDRVSIILVRLGPGGKGVRESPDVRCGKEVER